MLRLMLNSTLCRVSREFSSGPAQSPLLQRVRADPDAVARELVGGLGEGERRRLAALLTEGARQADKSHSSSARPAARDVLRAAAIVGVPYIAFGFLDNSIMLVAGSQIEQWLGQQLNLSVLASAGLGNTVADVCGVASAGFIAAKAQERFSRPLTEAQEQLPVVQSVAGGCLLGLIPLLFTRAPQHEPAQPEGGQPP